MKKKSHLQGQRVQFSTNGGRLDYRGTITNQAELESGMRLTNVERANHHPGCYVGWEKKPDCFIPWSNITDPVYI